MPQPLCPYHAADAACWAANDYQPHRPREWPAGAAVDPGHSGYGLMDSRTTHDERAREFVRKNQEQIDLITRICRSGRSPQCSADVPDYLRPYSVWVNDKKVLDAHRSTL